MMIPKEGFTDVSDDTSPTSPTYLVIIAKEVKIVKEVIACYVSPTAMFIFIGITDITKT